MSSYSEYLGRMKQRMTMYVDTRPHLTAGHQTEIIKRLAASANLETVVANTVCATQLDAITNNGAASFTMRTGGGHTVQDASDVLSYTAGQALAQGFMVNNVKSSQITMPCQSSTTIPELQDRIAADFQLDLKYQMKNAIRNCCTACGKVVFANNCACVGSKGFKHTPE